MSTEIFRSVTPFGLVLNVPRSRMGHKRTSLLKNFVPYAVTKFRELLKHVSMIQKGEQRIHELFDNFVPHAFRIFANFYSNGKTVGRSVLEGSKFLSLLISSRIWSAAPENDIVNEAYTVNCTVI